MVSDGRDGDNGGGVVSNVVFTHQHSDTVRSGASSTVSSSENMSVRYDRTSTPWSGA